MSQRRLLQRLVALLGWSLVWSSSQVPGAPDSWAPIPNPHSSVVGHWLFNETEGPTGEDNWGIYDQSGHGNHGFRGPPDQFNRRPRYNSDVPKPGDYNRSLDFGVSEGAQVAIPDSLSLDITEDLTVEAWINFSDLSGTQCIVAKRDGEKQSGGYSLEWHGHRFVFSVGNRQGWLSVSSVRFAPRLDQWHHVAGIRDSKTSTLRLYVDGELNNSALAGDSVGANAAPLTIGNSMDNKSPAHAKIDEVRISSSAVPSELLGFHAHYGPATIIFGDSFEGYTAKEDWFARFGGERNRWRRIEETSSVSIDATADYAKSGTHSILLRHHGADPKTDHEASLYYNLPVSATCGKAVIGMEGWVSFSSIDHVRLFWDQQVWTGSERHYGVKQTLLIGGMTYFGDSKTWSCDPQYRIQYSERLGDWHYYNLVLDYDKKEYVAFQFDQDVWDLRRKKISVLPGFFAPDLLPTIDHNIRLLEWKGDERRWSANFAQDDAVLLVYTVGDFNNDGDIDDADYEIMLANWHQSVPIGTSGDVTFDGTVDHKDLNQFREKLFHGDLPNTLLPAVSRTR